MKGLHDLVHEFDKVIVYLLSLKVKILIAAFESVNECDAC